MLSHVYLPESMFSFPDKNHYSPDIGVTGTVAVEWLVPEGELDEKDPFLVRCDSFVTTTSNTMTSVSLLSPSLFIYAKSCFPSELLRHVTLCISSTSPGRSGVIIRRRFRRYGRSIGMHWTIIVPATSAEYLQLSKLVTMSVGLPRNNTLER